MTYLVMENHLSYSVVLDEAGRFLKVANRCYKVGQTVENIVPLKAKTSTIPSVRVIGMVSSISACFVLMFSLYWYHYLAPVGSVYIKVNPEVQVEVSRKDTVVRLNGLNDDGAALIQDYAYRGKSLVVVSDELMDKAIAMGYLSNGDTVTIQLDAPDEDWFAREGIALRENLNHYLGEKITVNVVIHRFDPNDPDPQQAAPASSQAPTPNPTPSQPLPSPTPSQQPSSSSSNTQIPAPSQHTGDSGYGDDGDSGYVFTPGPAGGDSGYNNDDDSAYGNHDDDDSDIGDSGYDD